jgi:hypothetical protein
MLDGMPMMTPEFQRLLLQRLDASDAGAQRIERAIERQAERFDSFAEENAREHAALNRMVASHGAQLQLHEHRIGAAETSLGKVGEGLGDLSETTGKHEISKIESDAKRAVERARELEDGARYWKRWAVAVLVGLAASIATSLVTRVFWR